MTYGLISMKDDSGNKNALGRGLSALISEATVNSFHKNNDKNTSGCGVMMLPLSKIVCNNQQPRKHINHEALEELASSVREHGILQPILVRKLDDSLYQIIAGERRFHAAKKAELKEIPALIKNYNECDTLEIAIIENIQRAELSALEEANAYQKLIDEHSHTQETLSKRLGKSRSHVANILRLNKLPEEIKKLLAEDKITVGHARALINVSDPIEFARSILANNLNVRETERLAKKLNKKYEEEAKKKTNGAQNSANQIDDADILTLTKELAKSLQMKVTIKNKKGDGYNLSVECKNADDLDLVIAKLNNSNIF